MRSQCPMIRDKKEWKYQIRESQYSGLTTQDNFWRFKYIINNENYTTIDSELVFNEYLNCFVHFLLDNLFFILILLIILEVSIILSILKRISDLTVNLEAKF